jgi:RNA polymerase sigma-70 factor, ECF subfamily
MPDSDIMANMIFFAGSEENKASASTTRRDADALLVERIRRGDAEAFNELYKSFAPIVHGIILSRVPYAEVDDMVQEVFLTAFKSISSLRDKDAVGAWLMAIARNRAIQFYRDARPTEELPEDLDSPRRFATEANEIMAVIRSLPVCYSEPLVLRLVEGMTGQEISEMTGLTPDSVRVNLHRGMKLLRQKLGYVE